MRVSHGGYTAGSIVVGRSGNLEINSYLVSVLSQGIVCVHVTSGGGVNPFGRRWCWCSNFLVSSIRMSRYPTHLSPSITPTKPTKSQKSRARREPSGVFSLFRPQQIQQFKEAFSLIDQNRDGLIGERDLKDTFASLGAHSHAAVLTRLFIL